MTDNVLTHHGVRGMKWGVRKDRNKGSGSKDYKRTQKLRAKGARNLSTRELETVNKRLGAESTFRKLNPGKATRAMNLVKKFTAAGTTLAAAYAVTQTPAGKKAVSFVTNLLKKKKATDLTKWVL